MGYGRSSDAAEEDATTVNTRFATHYDGSGYEVLVAESWVVSAGEAPSAEGAEHRHATLGRSCDMHGPTRGLRVLDGSGRQPGCHLWNEGLAAGATVTWSGECVGGYTQGPGTEHWRYDEGQQTAQGAYVDGKPHGNWVTRYGDGDMAEGPYASGQRQGTWTWWFTEREHPGSTVRERRGKRQRDPVQP